MHHVHSKQPLCRAQYDGIPVGTVIKVAERNYVHLGQTVAGLYIFAPQPTANGRPAATSRPIQPRAANFPKLPLAHLPRNWPQPVSESEMGGSALLRDLEKMYPFMAAADSPARTGCRSLDHSTKSHLDTRAGGTVHQRFRPHSRAFAWLRLNRIVRRTRPPGSVQDFIQHLFDWCLASSIAASPGIFRAAVQNWRRNERRLRNRVSKEWHWLVPTEYRFRHIRQTLRFRLSVLRQYTPRPRNLLKEG